jgi:hydrogenase nickel incorporation protein HypA/HybF
MHEMSIVAGILRIAEDEARAAEAKVINSIELEIGQLAGIEIDSLNFCFEAARRGTMASGAELVIHDIPGLGYCPQCQKNVPVEFHLAVCQECDQALVEVSQGRELRVKSINVD